MVSAIQLETVAGLGTLTVQGRAYVTGRASGPSGPPNDGPGARGPFDRVKKLLVGPSQGSG